MDADHAVARIDQAAALLVDKAHHVVVDANPPHHGVLHAREVHVLREDEVVRAAVVAHLLQVLHVVQEVVLVRRDRCHVDQTQAEHVPHDRRHFVLHLTQQRWHYLGLDALRLHELLALLQRVEEIGRDDDIAVDVAVVRAVQQLATPHEHVSDQRHTVIIHTTPYAHESVKPVVALCSNVQGVTHLRDYRIVGVHDGTKRVTALEKTEHVERVLGPLRQFLFLTRQNHRHLLPKQFHGCKQHQVQFLIRSGGG